MKPKFDLIKYAFCFCLLLPAQASHTFAQAISSDNGNGTYTNPLIPADFPDPDVIRVDDMYYMVTCLVLK